MDKELELLKLISECTVNQSPMGSPFNYFDTESRKNIDKKIKVLTKLANYEELTEDEFYDREVFELYPEDMEKGTILW